MFQPTEWVIPSAGFFSKTVECDALVQNGAFFMELDAAVIMESINKGINHDVIGAISSNRKPGLVYNSEIVTLKFTNQIFIESVCFAQVDTF